MVEETFRILPQGLLRAFQHYSDKFFAAALGGGNKVERTAVNAAGVCRLSCFDADSARVTRQQNVGVPKRALPTRTRPGIIFLGNDAAKLDGLKRGLGD